MRPPHRIDHAAFEILRIAAADTRRKINISLIYSACQRATVAAAAAAAAEAR